MRDLATLARRAPELIRERLDGLPATEQAELVLLLPARERLEVLLHAPRPMALVRMLPDAELYLTVREVGPTDALPLLSLASASQLLHLIDLESWRRDRFDAERCGAWVALLLEAGEPTLRRFLKNADEELLVLLLRGWSRVREIELDDTPDARGAGETEAGTESGFVSPDGYHRFCPARPEHAPAVRRFAEVLAATSPARYQDLLWSSRWQSAAEVEERALHWRQSRLEEHGYPPWDEALSVYAPPTGVRSHASMPPTATPGSPAVARLALRCIDPRGPLLPALDRLTAAERERALHETVAVANRVLVADGADTGDPDAHRNALRKAGGYVSIALAARGARDDAAAAEVMRDVPVVELFREGYARAAEVQRRARDLVENGWASRHPKALELLDSPIRPGIVGLLQPRPLYHDGRGGQDNPYREFASLGEIDEARIAVRIAEVLGRVFVERLGLDLEAVLREDLRAPGPRRFSAVFLTALAWNSARGELRCEPLPPEVTERFLRDVVSRRLADPGAPERALREFLERLAHGISLDRAAAQALEAFGRACLDKLIEECAGLDPAVPVDPRYVSCLLIASRDRG